jgi:hypothetical protein
VEGLLCGIAWRWTWYKGSNRTSDFRWSLALILAHFENFPSPERNELLNAVAVRTVARLL